MTVTPPRTQKALLRRRKMLEVAVRIFAKEGFRNADVQVIADLAGAGKGTIYRHFGNKEELFLASARASVEWMAEFVVGRVGGADADAGTLIREIATACAEYCEEHPETIELMIQERAEFRGAVFPTALMFRSDNTAPLDELVRMGIAQGQFRPADSTSVSNAILDLIYGTSVCGVLEGGHRRLVVRMQFAIDQFLRGICVSTVHDAPSTHLGLGANNP